MKITSILLLCCLFSLASPAATVNVITPTRTTLTNATLPQATGGYQLGATAIGVSGLTNLTIPGYITLGNTTNRISDDGSNLTRNGTAIGGGGGAANWTASGTTNSLLAGSAQVHNLTATNKVTIGSGDAQSVYYPTVAQRLSVAKGTAATPDTDTNNLVKVERLINMDNTQIAGDGGEHAAALMAITVGTTQNAVQAVGLYGAAKSSSTNQATTGADDACAIYGVSRITGSGTGISIGGFLNARRDTATASATALELSTENNTATAEPYISTGFSKMNGIWLHGTGSTNSSVGMAFGNPFGPQFDVGIGFTSQVAGGQTGAVTTTSIRDDGNSLTSLAINGSHATAAIAVAPNAGGVYIGSTGVSAAGGLFEVIGPNVTTDPLVVIGSVANTRLYTTRIRNASGQLVLGIIGTAGQSVVGSAVGDAHIGTSTAGKALHLGGTTKVITVTTANTLGFFGVTPVAVQGSTTDLKNVLVNYGLLTDGGATPLDTDLGAITAGTITANGINVMSREFLLACSDLTTAITAGTGKAYFYTPYACTVTRVKATLDTVQTSGATFTVDINEAGVSILSTKLTIDNTEPTSITAAVPPVISDTALADNAKITIDVDGIGDGTAKGLIVEIDVTRP